MNVENLKQGVEKHGNKVFNSLSAGAIIWLYAMFVTKEDYKEHCRKCEGYVTHTEFDRERQDTKESRSALWRKIADNELKVDMALRLDSYSRRTNQPMRINP